MSSLGPARASVAGVGVAALLGLVLAPGCSGGDDGAAGASPDGGGGGQVTSAGGASTGGGAPGAGGASTGSCEPGAAGGAGPPLIGCGQIGGVCGGCIAGNACDLFTFKCAVNADCVCMARCIGGSGLNGTTACLGTCGLSGSPPGFAELAEVVAVMCPDSDECSVPAGFTPPPGPPAGPSSGGGIGAGSLPDCSFDPGLRYDPNGEVLQLRSADGSVCVRVERRNDGPGSNANTSWTLLDLRVGPTGEVCRIADPASGCWYSSHHNFDDWAHALCGGKHYDLNVAMADHGALPTYALHVFADGPLGGGSCAPAADGLCPIGTPIDLVPVQ